MSIRTIFASLSNKHSARLFASSVLPTPVGPIKRNEPIGLVGSLMPALERIIASATFVTPSSCPITLLWSSSSRCSVLFLSDSVNLATGIPVQREIICAISSSETLSCTIRWSLVLAAFSASSINCCNRGSSPYSSSDARSKSPLFFAISIWLFASSISVFNWWILSTAAFSLSQRAFLTEKSSCSSLNSFCSSVRRPLLKLSVSFFSAASSICSCIIFRWVSSSSVGSESSSVLISAHASSTKSIALSGRKRSVM